MCLIQMLKGTFCSDAEGRDKMAVFDAQGNETWLRILMESQIMKSNAYLEEF